MVRQRIAKPRRITKSLINHRRLQLTREISEALYEIIGKYDLVEIERKGSDKLNEPTLLDVFIEQYKERKISEDAVAYRNRGE